MCLLTNVSHCLWVCWSRRLPIRELQIHLCTLKVITCKLVVQLRSLHHHSCRHSLPERESRVAACADCSVCWQMCHLQRCKGMECHARNSQQQLSSFFARDAPQAQRAGGHCHASQPTGAHRLVEASFQVLSSVFARPRHTTGVPLLPSCDCCINPCMTSTILEYRGRTVLPLSIFPSGFASLASLLAQGKRECWYRVAFVVHCSSQQPVDVDSSPA